jgi:hypothetical protein
MPPASAIGGVFCGAARAGAKEIIPRTDVGMCARFKARLLGTALGFGGSWIGISYAEERKTCA